MIAGIIELVERVTAWVPWWLRWTVVGTAALLLLVQVGRMVPGRPSTALLISVVVLAVGLTAVEPAVLPLLALPMMVVVTRVGAGGLDVSVSDAALMAAFVPAFFLAKRPFSPALRKLLWLSAVYQLATLFTVVANPYLRNTIEWFHTWLLVSGALVVGWAVGRQGYARLGLNILLLSSGAIAVVAIVVGLQRVVRGDLEPVYLGWPWPMHKNFLGGVFALSALVAYVRPDWLRMGKGMGLSLFWMFVVALGFTQSRQALIALAVTLTVVVLRREPGRSRSKIILLAVVPALALIGMTVREQVESGNKFNSVFQRVSWFQDAIDIWLQSPVYGVGLRWWYDDRFDVRFQPPNAEVEMLTTAGVVGLVGFLVLMLGGLLLLWRLDPRFGTLASAVLLARLVQGQLDLFWFSGQATAFLVIGLVLGAKAVADDEERLAAWAAVHDRPPERAVAPS